MEKVLFNDLKKEKDITVDPVVVKINDIEVEVKDYLPVNEKLNLISRVLQQVAQNEYPFANPVQMDVYSALEIIYAYSNIEFSDEDKENPAELYVTLETQGIINTIIAKIPEVEYKFLMEGITASIDAFYNYRNSVRGLLEDITTDYSNLNLDAEGIKDKIADPKNLTLLKDVMTKLG